MRGLIIIGAGGHGKSVYNAAVSCGMQVEGFLDDTMLVGEKVLGAKVIGKVCEAKNFPYSKFVIAIGDNLARCKIANQYKLNYTTVIHSMAVVSPYAKIQCGTVILAHAVVNANAFVGMHCIINSAAVVEHDCFIDNFAHIAPNATATGSVYVGFLALIGANSSIINKAHVGAGAIVASNSAVIANVASLKIVGGVPATKIERASKKHIQTLKSFITNLKC